MASPRFRCSPAWGRVFITSVDICVMMRLLKISYFLIAMMNL